MSKRVTYAVCALMLAAACARKAGVETIAAGTDVTVKQTNGVSVIGKLVAVTPDQIVVDEKNGARRTLNRRDVTSVAMMTDVALAAQPNAEAAARAGASVATPAPTATSEVPSDRVEPPPAAAPTSGRAPASDALSRDRSPLGAAAPPQVVREVTIPAGTPLPVRLETSVGSDISHVEDPVRGTLARNVSVAGTVIPAGSEVIGSVTSVRRPGKVKGLSYIALRFHTLVAHDEKYAIRATRVARTGRATKKKDAATIGIPAAGGAVVGGILGGKKGAAIGGAAGGGAGTAVVLSTRGEEVRLGRGALVTVRLTAPVTVHAPR